MYGGMSYLAGEHWGIAEKSMISFLDMFDLKCL